MAQEATSKPNVTQTFPFSNKGLVQKVDINQLAENQYPFLLNTKCVQEGAMKPRGGWEQFTTTWGVQPAYIHTIGVNRSSPNDDLYVYMGEGTNVQRAVYNGIVSSSNDIIAENQGDSRGSYPTWRSSGAGSVPMTYFASGVQDSRRDNGSYTVARCWGISPPVDYARCAPGQYSFVNIIKDAAFNGTYTSASRLTDTVSAVAAVVANSGADGYYAITPTGGATTIDKILPGMYLKVGSQDIFVDKVDAVAGKFYAHFSSLPAAGNSIDGYQTTPSASNTPGSVLDTTSDAISVNLAFNGDAADGFDSDDNIHISLYIDTPTTINDIRFRLQAGGSTADFYEKSIIPSPAQDVVSGATDVANTSRADTSLDEYGKYQSTGVYGQLDNTQIQDQLGVNPYVPPPSNINAGLQPANPTPQITAGWQEFTFSKRDFLKVGRAGQSGYTWAEITAVQIVVKPPNTTDTVTIKIGSIFGFGGSGLNSDRSQALQPYDYIYTYYDSAVQSESNPSPFMIQSSWVRVGKQAIKVQVRGFYDPGADPKFDGIDKIRIYRRGGAYTDGLFRLVGTITNPGTTAAAAEANTAIFEDSVDDISLIASPTALFDNDPPITVSLSEDGVAEITSVSGSNGFYTIAINSSFVPIYDGTKLTITPTDNDADSIIYTVAQTGPGLPGTPFTAYCQREPQVGERVTVTSIPRACGDVAGIALGRMWMTDSGLSDVGLGGAVGKAYSSKTGNPEAWPIINDLTGNAHVIDVTSSDNPINGIIEYGGEAVFLAQNGIYTVKLDQGRIAGPFKTPSSRGLFCKGAFCEVDNEIWFLAYDGIYAWGGGACRKVSLEIDPMFRGETVNGIKPVDMYGTFGSFQAVEFFSMAQKGNEVWFSFLNTDGYFCALRYHLIFERWSLEEYYDDASTVTISRNGYTLPVTSITSMTQDKATGEIVAAFSTTSGITTTASLAYLDTLEVDKDSGGRAIYYEIETKSWDFGLPMQQKNFTDLGVEVTIGATSDDYIVKTYYDYSASATNTLSLSPSATGRKIFQLPLGQSGSPAVSFGTEARVASFRIIGQSTDSDTAWHGLAITFINLADLIKGRVMDWTDLGHPWDKRMNTVTIEYDTGSSTVDLYLDYISSKDGDTINLAAQTITLGSGSGTGRSKQTFPIVDGVVAKMVRLRPKVATAQYQIFGMPEWNFEPYPADIVYFTDYSDYGHAYEKRFYVLYINVDTNGQDVTVDIEGDGSVKQTVTVNGTAANRMISKAINVDIVAKLVRLKVTNIASGGKFQLFDHKFEKENFPPEIVLSTPWEDQGHQFDKYAEQILFDVNTNGYTVPVKVYGDGVLKQTINVNSTQATRNVNVTLNPSLTYQQMRLEVDPAQIPSGGRFQLWHWEPVWQPADKGPVGHSFDWTDAGHPYDKKFVEMTFEYETDSNNVQIGIDTLTGIDGTTQTTNVKTFTINSPGRGKAVIPMTSNSGAEIIAKMVRVHSNGTNGGGTNLPDFKMWNVQFPGLIPYPADKVPFTEWTDAGWACDKCFRGLGLEIDTGGVACTVYMDIDGSTAVKQWTVNTTTGDRRVFLSSDVETEVCGKQFRLRFEPGANGKCQLFGQPNWDLVKDACEFVFFDTFEQAFGSAGYTILWQQWIDYKCEGGVRVTFYDENNAIFYTKDLPAHATRYPERFYLPVQSNGVNNKSKKHRITLEALDYTKPFLLYRDSSRTEVYNLSADQRAGFYQNIIWQNIKIEV